MSDPESAEEACRLIGARLKKLAKMRCRDVISEERFVEAVLNIESRQVVPGGFTVSASHTPDGWTLIEIRMKGFTKVCAAFEFDPKTGDFRDLDSAQFSEPGN